MPSRKIEDTYFAIIDTETTGISPKAARVCEVAGVISRGYEELSHFSWLINPEMPMPYSAFKVHGISDQMLADKPAFSGIAAKFLSNIENTVIVGHNIMFDINFLNMELSRLGLKFPILPVIDTLALARKNHLFTSNSLSAISHALCINNDCWHRALADAQATRQVLYFFLKRIERQHGVCTFETIHKISGGKYVKQ